MPVEIEPCKRPILFELTQTANLAAGMVSRRTRTGGHLSVACVANWTRVTWLHPPLRRLQQRASLRPVRRAGFGALPLASLPSLFAGAVGYALTRGGGKSTPQPATSDIPTASAASTVQAAPVTLAVLPFANLSSDPEQEYFSDGLTEEILNQLAQVKGLLVTGRTSSFSFKGKNEDLRVIGEKLGVANLLEGSVRKDGDQLRVTAQLIDGTTGGHLWSKTYDREQSGVFDMQEEIARDVAKALSVKLEVGELAGRPGMTRNIEAYDAYLAAARFNEPTPESVRAAMDLLERATALDPAFVVAWVSLANTYSFAASLRLPGNTPAGWAARRTPSLNGSRASPTIGQIVFELLVGDRAQTQWDMVAAQQHFDKSRAIAKDRGIGLGPYGTDAVFVLVTGRFREAIALLEQAKVADPLNAFDAFLLCKGLCRKRESRGGRCRG